MLSNLNWFDYVILAIFAFSGLIGLSRGLVKEILSLLTLIAAFVVASLFANTLATMFTNSAMVQNLVSHASSSGGMDASKPVSYIAVGISFGLIFIATVLIGAILSAIIGLAFQTGVLGFGNRLLGACFGLVRGFIINLVIIFLIQLSPLNTEAWWQKSQMVAMFQPVIAWLGGVVSPNLKDIKARFNETLEGVGSSVQSMTNSITHTSH